MLARPLRRTPRLYESAMATTSELPGPQDQQKLGKISRKAKDTDSLAQRWSEANAVGLFTTMGIDTISVEATGELQDARHGHPHEERWMMPDWSR